MNPPCSSERVVTGEGLKSYDTFRANSSRLLKFSMKFNVSTTLSKFKKFSALKEVFKLIYPLWGF